MSWAVDYSDAWRALDGVQDAELYLPNSATKTADVKVRADTLTAREIAGGAFGIGPTDDAWFVWGAEPVQEGRIVIGSASYTVLSVERSPHGGYVRVATRKRV